MNEETRLGGCPVPRTRWSVLGAMMAVTMVSVGPAPALVAVDAVYVNGTVITVDASDRIAQAVAVTGDRVQAVGTDADIKALAGPATRVVDLAGKTLVPGFVDAHSHFPISGQIALYRVDVNSPPIGTVRNIDDIIQKLKKKAEPTPKGEWIVGVGYDDTLLAEKRHPTRSDLDRASTEHPILVLHISLHLASANSMRLKAANITRDAPDPKGGEIRRDPATGEPDGVLVELSAWGLVYAKVPKLTQAQNLEAIRYAAREYAARGVTTAQNGHLSDAGELRHLVEAVAQGQLPLRLVLWPSLGMTKAIAEGKVTAALPDGRIKLGATKLFADGSIQGYTGYLSQPYHVPPPGQGPDYRSHPTMPRDQLAAIVKELHRAGRQVAIHGNGDAAIDDIIHAVADAQREFPRQDARHIVNHAQMARDDQLDRMKGLGITPSFFVLHTYYWGDRHRDIFMGPARAARMSPAKSAADRGMRFTIHTDTPVVPMDMLFLIWAAVSRRSTSGQVIGEAERLTPLQALRAVTIDAAWQAFEERIKGSIEPGKLADFVILSDNPLRVPAAIKDITVLETIVGGKTVYRSP
jgi:predicted amidohydrolase YtcJ